MRHVGRKAGIAAFVLLLLAYILYRHLHSKTLSPIVEISAGKLQGVVSYTRGKKEVFEYLGIPFANAPVGNLRFEPPQPPEPWVGVRDATEAGSQCIQANMITGGTFGSEDCLFLNVYTPKERKGLLPVMVWIHGGAFAYGSADAYRPAYLLDEDVILVTTNYRLAALGFLNTGDGLIKGNMGLKDQQMALKWVQENIKHFGGDPKQVTLFGESAGGVCTGFHLLSPMSKDLFSRAVIQSGSPLGNFVVNREPGKQAKYFAEKFHCGKGKPQEMVTCLKNVEGKALVEADQDIPLFMRDAITLFVPTIETIQDNNTFIGEEPLESLMSGRVNKVPLIIGVNKEEGLLSSAVIVTNETRLRQANDEWSFFAPKILRYDPKNQNATDKIRKFYFGDATDIATKALFANYTNMFSDRHFFQPAHKFVKQYAKYSAVRMYLYSYSAELSLGDMLAATQSERLPALASVLLDLLKRWVYRKAGHEIPHLGVCHGDEVQLLFDWPINFIGDHHKDFEMSKMMVKLWTDFAKNKDPIRIYEIKWPVINLKQSQTLEYLNLNMNPRMEDEPFSSRMVFWDSLGLTSVSGESVYVAAEAISYVDQYKYDEDERFLWIFFCISSRRDCFT